MQAPARGSFFAACPESERTERELTIPADWYSIQGRSKGADSHCEGSVASIQLHAFPPKTGSQMRLRFLFQMLIYVEEPLRKSVRFGHDGGPHCDRFMG